MHGMKRPGVEQERPRPPVSAASQSMLPPAAACQAWAQPHRQTEVPACCEATMAMTGHACSVASPSSALQEASQAGMQTSKPKKASRRQAWCIGASRWSGGPEG
jgi:hypothetical protein